MNRSQKTIAIIALFILNMFTQNLFAADLKLNNTATKAMPATDRATTPPVLPAAGSASIPAVQNRNVIKRAEAYRVFGQACNPTIDAVGGEFKANGYLDIKGRCFGSTKGDVKIKCTTPKNNTAFSAIPYTVGTWDDSRIMISLSQTTANFSCKALIEVYTSDLKLANSVPFDYN
jgi:hypothetical protein